MYSIGVAVEIELDLIDERTNALIRGLIRSGRVEQVMIPMRWARLVVAGMVSAGFARVSDIVICLLERFLVMSRSQDASLTGLEIR